jgi:hypothetical protein
VAYVETTKLTDTALYRIRAKGSIRPSVGSREWGVGRRGKGKALPIPGSRRLWGPALPGSARLGSLLQGIDDLDRVAEKRFG